MEHNEFFDSEELPASVKIPGEYLVAWNAINTRLMQSQSKINYSDYIVAFEETDEEYMVTFSKPFKERVLGGGIGTYRVKKSDLSVSGRLSR